MIEISIPDYFRCAQLIINLINLMNEQPEKFNEDTKVGSVYGCFPCIWNGGRTQPMGFFTREDVESATNFLNKNGITIRHTFTNCLLEESDLDDTKGNLILEATKEAQLIKNDVNVGCETMENYIREKYPEFNLIYSTTLCLTDIDKINQLSEKDLLVLDYSFNNDFEKLKELKHPENIEILVNERCHDNCPVRRKHYLTLSKANLKIELSSDDIADCVYKEDDRNYYKSSVKRKSYISIDDIREKYLPLGFNKFKIVGRNMTPLFCVEGLCDYLVKPEFRNEIRFELLREYFGM